MVESELSPIPSPSLLDTICERLSAAPLSLKDATKGLAKTGKKAPPPPDFDAILNDGVQSGRVFKHPSGSKGAVRYWVRDEESVIRDAVLESAIAPKKLAELKKVAKVVVTKTDKKFADAVVDRMVSDHLIHPQGTKSSAPYGREKLPEKNNREQVRAALLEAATAPQSLTNLIKSAVAATKADKAFVTTEADALIAAEQLFKQSDAKNAPYGREKPKPPPPPPHPLEIGKGKTAFAKLVDSARKLLKSIKTVPILDLIDRLQTALATEEPKTETVEPQRKEAQESPRVEALFDTTVSPAPAPQLAPERIRAGLKAAYDELCLYREFEDKTVEIRRLFHEAKRDLPDLTVESFHRELEHLQQSREVELHSLNEVQLAKEPELALRRGDRLLYYVMWRKA